MTSKEKIENIKLVNEMDAFHEKMSVYVNCELVEVVEVDNTTIEEIPDYRKSIKVKDLYFFLGYIDEKFVFYRKDYGQMVKILTYEEVEEETYDELKTFAIKNGLLKITDTFEGVLNIFLVIIMAFGILAFVDGDGEGVFIGIAILGLSAFLFAITRILSYVKKIYIEQKRMNTK